MSTAFADEFGIANRMTDWREMIATDAIDAFDVYMVEKGKLRASEVKEGEEENETCGT